MDRKPVKSSSVRSAGFDPTTGRLEVEFARGTLYSYKGVSQEMYDGLMAAESAGKFYAQHIRGKYDYSKG